MLPWNLNWNNICLRGFLEFLQKVNCTKLERSQNTIYICFRINLKRWNAKIRSEKYTPKIQKTKIFSQVRQQIPKNVPGLAPSIYFTVLAKFQTMTYIKKERKRTNRLKKNKTDCYRKTNTKNIEYNTLRNVHSKQVK